MKSGFIDQVIEDAFAGLDEHSQSEAVERALARFKTHWLKADRVRQELLRVRAIKFLKERSLGSARLMDAALKPPASQSSEGGLAFPREEPWAEPVEIGAVLGDIRMLIEEHMVLPKGAAVAIALWTVLTYVFDLFDILPSIGVVSPLRRCGKTRFLSIVKALSHRALMVSNTSVAVIYRTIESSHPTLLFDEAETYVLGNEEMRGILNSGHTRSGAAVLRCSGDEHETKSFSTWTPKGFALIGDLPATLEDRSVVIPMRRRSADEKVSRLTIGKLERMSQPIRRKLVRWSEEAATELVSADPSSPDELHDRAADNWRPLFAIADVAGGPWPDAAREAAIALQKSVDDGDDHVATLLLDIRTIVGQRREARIASAYLAGELGEMEDRPWPEWKGTKPITPTQLAQLLKPFGIKPKKMRVQPGKEPVQGYEVAWFNRIFRTYLPAEPEQVEQTEQTETEDVTGDDAATMMIAASSEAEILSALNELMEPE